MAPKVCAGSHKGYDKQMALAQMLYLPGFTHISVHDSARFKGHHISQRQLYLPKELSEASGSQQGQAHS